MLWLPLRTRRGRPHRAGFAVAALALVAWVPIPQAAPVRELSERLATTPRGFTRIAAVRELSDGRLILVDADDRAVHLLSADLRTATPIGRIGEGPGEYQLPTRVLPLRGDTSVITDQALGRLLIVLPDGRPGDVVLLSHAQARRRLREPVASDGMGGLYLEGPMPTLPSGVRERADSMAILRWERDGALDTVGFLPVRVRPIGTVSPPSPPFSPRMLWRVSADGRLAIVFPEPFHVVFRSYGGGRREGPTIEHDPIRVTDRHKEAYRQQQERPVLGFRSVRGERGRSIAMVQRPFTEPPSWPKHLPPFLSDARMEFAPDGTLWLERSLASPDEAPTYDLIDRVGMVSARVRLPPGRRLLGFGRGSVYVVRRDEFDLEYLERYAG